MVNPAIAALDKNLRWQDYPRLWNWPMLEHFFACAGHNNGPTTLSINSGGHLFEVTISDGTACFRQDGRQVWHEACEAFDGESNQNLDASCRVAMAGLPLPGEDNHEG